MIKEIKIIYLDEYDQKFRLGYDSAFVVQAIKELLKAFMEQHVVKCMYVNIHKDSLSNCQGLCAENLFHSEIKAPLQSNIELKNTDEVWLMIQPSKMLKK